MKKHLLRTAGSLLLLLCLLTGCGQQSSSVENSVDEAVELVKDIPTTQYFTDEAVSEDAFWSQCAKRHESTALAFFGDYKFFCFAADRR